jgi:hypothetical protein
LPAVNFLVQHEVVLYLCVAVTYVEISSGVPHSTPTMV